MNDVVNWVARQGFLPHGVCFQWSSDLLVTSVASNAIIAIAYFSIAFSILVFLDRQKGKFQMGWILLLFSSFIFLCGTTHLIDILTVWYPAYWLQAWVCAATALVSIATAFVMWPIVTNISTRLGVQAKVLEMQTEIDALKVQLAEAQKTGST